MGLLSLLVWAPIFAGLALVAFSGQKYVPVVRWGALLASLAIFALSLQVYAGFDNAEAGMQFVEYTQWIPSINSNYHLGIDGISLWLVLLNTFITVLVVLA